MCSKDLSHEHGAHHALTFTCTLAKTSSVPARLCGWFYGDVGFGAVVAENRHMHATIAVVFVHPMDRFSLQ